MAGFHTQHEWSNQAKSGKSYPDKMCWSPIHAHNQKMKAIGAALGKYFFSCGMTTVQSGIMSGMGWRELTGAFLIYKRRKGWREWDTKELEVKRKKSRKMEKEKLIIEAWQCEHVQKFTSFPMVGWLKKIKGRIWSLGNEEILAVGIILDWKEVRKKIIKCTSS